METMIDSRDSALLYYGPHACSGCYPTRQGEPGTQVRIVKVAREQGGAEYDYPDGLIYPNTVWVPHVHRQDPPSCLPPPATAAVPSFAPSVPNGGDSGQLALIHYGETRLHSGQLSMFKIDCDALSDADIHAAAHVLRDRLAAFGSVEGVPRGGQRLAAAMRSFVTTGPLLVVDDVVTTGASMEQQRAGRDAIGAVLFARGPVSSWVTPLFMTLA